MHRLKKAQSRYCDRRNIREGEREAGRADSVYQLIRELGLLSVLSPGCVTSQSPPLKLSFVEELPHKLADSGKRYGNTLVHRPLTPTVNILMYPGR
jgi:hypothetical protein